MLHYKLWVSGVGSRKQEKFSLEMYYGENVESNMREQIVLYAFHGRMGKFDTWVKCAVIEPWDIKPFVFATWTAFLEARSLVLPLCNDLLHHLQLNPFIFLSYKYINIKSISQSTNKSWKARKHFHFSVAPTTNRCKHSYGKEKERKKGKFVKTFLVNYVFSSYLTQYFQ